MAAAASLWSCHAPPLGIRDGGLFPCPDSPNCVSSQATGTAHRVEPLVFSGDPRAAWRHLKVAVESLPRTEIIEESDDYLRAVSSSLVFRFKDDLECLLDRQTSVIHIRAAARVGHSDLGANRARVERLRELFSNVEER